MEWIKLHIEEILQMCYIQLDNVLETFLLSSNSINLYVKHIKGIKFETWNWAELGLNLDLTTSYFGSNNGSYSRFFNLSESVYSDIMMSNNICLLSWLVMRLYGLAHCD